MDSRDGINKFLLNFVALYFLNVEHLLPLYTCSYIDIFIYYCLCLPLVYYSDNQKTLNYEEDSLSYNFKKSYEI